MGKENPKDAELNKNVSKSEGPLLLVAAVSVFLYICWLYGMWASYEGIYQVISGIIDFIFVVDLLLKLWRRRLPYVKTPWFLIDLISTLPAISLFYPIHAIDPSLRAVRSFRFLRLIRSVRVLNLLKNLKRSEDVQIVSEDEKRYIASMYGAIIVFTITVVGILEAIYYDIDSSSPQGAENLISAQKQESFLILGSILGLMVVIWVVRNQIPAISRQQVGDLLNIALPHQVAVRFLEHPELYNSTVRMPATVVFCDIQGFTSAVEAIGDDLDTFKSHLEDAMDAIVNVHIKHDLIVDKFIGDCVMSFRGGDMVEGSQQDHAYRVVRAAIESVLALHALGDPYFRNVRIGGATGDRLLIGAFGTSRRLSYTVLGDRVNLASRLENACKKVGASNLFCRKTRDLLQQKTDIKWRSMGVFSVRGKSQPVEVFEAFDNTDESKLAWIDSFNQAIQCKSSGDVAKAITLLQLANEQRPGGDLPAQILLREIS